MPLAAGLASIHRTAALPSSVRRSVAARANALVPTPRCPYRVTNRDERQNWINVCSSPSRAMSGQSGMAAGWFRISTDPLLRSAAADGTAGNWISVRAKRDLGCLSDKHLLLVREVISSLLLWYPDHRPAVRASGSDLSSHELPGKHGPNPLSGERSESTPGHGGVEMSGRHGAADVRLHVEGQNRLPGTVRSSLDTPRARPLPWNGEEPTA